MKIKNWLISSYIIVILAPIFVFILLYVWIQQYNKQIEMKDYINSINKFEKYDIILQNPELYTHPKDSYDLVFKEEKSNTKVTLYDIYGLRIYSSMNDNIYPMLNREQLYKDLYKINHGYRADTLKKPVFKDDKLVGFYEVTISRSNWVKGVNERTLIAMLLFILILLTVLVVTIKIINKKLNKPLDLLISSMSRFALGQDVKISYQSEDEIGNLISHFNNMKNEIMDKRKELEEQQKSKEYMIATISHDLKTPLTSIRAYTELLQSHNKNTKGERYVSTILNKCDYMNDMLEDLLMYTILTSDYNIDFVEVEGQEFFEMLTSEYEEICEKRGLKYVSQVNVEGMYKVGVNQMIRVMDNLITNAIKHSKEASVIHAGAFSDNFSLPGWLDDSYVEELDEFRKEGAILIVKNEGQKISEEDLKKIFERFYKSDNERSIMKKSGTGLGLSIVKLIIERHFGKIKILSSENKGTVIACWIKTMED
ncbi:Two-component sensor histidine kinase [Gottschalkia purinilytica]|uniref:histidine kinase n=1 Tax=Gottschalkia purinilytica TaxID=1503 RepID=A0A0L0W9G1_GOTPU|nr:HAMP domain-containing sensor histidine kinase [Gottschalkia purinilytica]KNF08193.1 Two-component sensor histidine kinase [Gottschalkia purinilytica]